jgi:glycosyltransferase involved in cell wall biosynthesis
VATAVGGVPEVVTDGETGRLVPARDPGALAGVLADLAIDPAERERLRTNGRQAVAASFTWDALYDRYERALGSIVDRDRPTMERAR